MNAKSTVCLCVYMYVYNELIFDPGNWQRALPRAIEAFFYVAGTPPSRAKSARDDFLRAFPEEASTPLLKLDVKNRAAPFSAAS